MFVLNPVGDQDNKDEEKLRKFKEGIGLSKRRWLLTLLF